MVQQPVEILLVEDNPTDAELAMRALKKQNLANRVYHAKDGAEALDFIAKSEDHFPRVILLDLKLPKVDGLQVLKKLKNDERTRRIPIVVMTSSKEEQDVVRSYALGVNSYIVKPVDFDKFIQCVSDLGLYWLVVNHPPA